MTGAPINPTEPPPWQSVPEWGQGDPETELLDDEFPQPAPANGSNGHSGEDAIRGAVEKAVAPRDSRTSPETAVALFDPTTLDGKKIPLRKWCVKGWIPSGTTTAFYGDGGTGKTLVAIGLGVAAALGMNDGCERLWLGMAVRPSRTFLFLCEDDQDEIHRRSYDWLGFFGKRFRDLGHLRWESRVGLNNLFITFDRSEGHITELFKDLTDKAKAFGATLIVIDTGADTFGGDEIKKAEVRQFVQRCCNNLAREIEGAVLLLLHPSRDGMKSGRGDGGNVAWNATVRSRLYLSPVKKEPADGALEAEEDDADDDSSDLRILSKKKANYSDLDAIKIRWRNGVFVPEQPGGAEKQGRDRGAERAFMEALAEIQSDGGHPSPWKSSPQTYAPKMAKATKHGKPYRLDELEAAMGRLKDAGKIAFTETKRDGKTRAEVLIKEEETQASDV